jgi:hypothetical protein
LRGFKDTAEDLFFNHKGNFKHKTMFKKFSFSGLSGFNETAEADKEVSMRARSGFRGLNETVEFLTPWEPSGKRLLALIAFKEKP